MNKKSNMALWDSLKETPSVHTKPARNMLTAINTQYCFMRATEAFGSCGIGWGYEILEERFDEGATHSHGGVEFKAITHTVLIELWYKIDDQTGKIKNYGHTPFVMRSNNGPYQDDEAPKKSLSDAIKKCLSMVGVGADIHLGQYDDYSYKQELELKARQELELKREEKEAAIKNEIAEAMAEKKISYSKATTIPALNQMHKKALNDIRRKYEQINQAPDSAIAALNDLYDKQKHEVTK
jgi:hypothetical protein